MEKWARTRDIDGLSKWTSNPNAKRAHPSPDHFLPLLYAVGAADEGDECVTFDDDMVMGSLSMRAFAYIPRTKDEQSAKAQEQPRDSGSEGEDK